MRKVFNLSVFFLFFCCFGLVHAYGQILLENGKVSLSFQPGQTFTGKVKIINTTDKKVIAKAYFEDFSYIPPFDGSKQFSFFGTLPYSFAGLVSFFPEEILLPPFGREEVSYTFRAPEDPEDGYYGVLFFENREEQKDANTGLNIVTRVGSLFFLEKVDALRQMDISGFLVRRNKIQGTIKNKSQIILIPNGIFYIMNSEGMVVDRGEVEALYLPPDEEAPFLMNIDEDLIVGTYTLILTFDLGEGNVFVNEIDLEKTKERSLRILQVRE
jgi:hypothetical protein